MSFEEKRAAKRKPLVVQVTYWVDGQERAAAYRVDSVNVSRDGILLRADLPLAIGTEIKMEFSLPGRVKKIRVRGEVVWSNELKGSDEQPFTGKGIHFIGYEKGCRDLLQDYAEE